MFNKYYKYKKKYLQLIQSGGKYKLSKNNTPKYIFYVDCVSIFREKTKSYIHSNICKIPSMKFKISNNNWGSAAKKIQHFIGMDYEIEKIKYSLNGVEGEIINPNDIMDVDRKYEYIKIYLL